MADIGAGRGYGFSRGRSFCSIQTAWRKSCASTRESVIQIANNTIILKTLQQEDSDAYTRGRRVSEEVVKSLLLERKNRDQQLHGLFYARPKPDLRTAREHVKRGCARGLVSEEKNATQDGWYLYFATGQQENLMAIVKTIQNIDVNSYRTEISAL